MPSKTPDMAERVDVLETMNKEEGLEPKEAELILLSDDELVTYVYDLVGEIHDDDEGLNESVKVKFDFALTEAFERFAPNSAWKDVLGRLDTNNRKVFEREIEGHRGAMIGRAVARWESRSKSRA